VEHARKRRLNLWAEQCISAFRPCQSKHRQLPVDGAAGLPVGLRLENPVEAHTLRALEFDAIREALMRLAMTPIGKETAGSLEPHATPDAVRASLKRTTLMRTLLAGRTLPLGDLGDPRPVLKRASLEGALDGPELLRIVALLRALRLTRKLLSSSLSDLGEENLPTLPDLEEKLLASLDSDGRLRDTASRALQSIRKRIGEQAARLRSTVEQAGAQPQVRQTLQSPTPTTRDGRLVLAVRADKRRTVPGVLHGRSASGETVFIEPAGAVEEGNRLREYQEDERAEENRLFRELSALVNRQSSALQTGLASLGRLDLLAAKALLADKTGAVEPRLNTEGVLELRAARHPLLKRRAVPIDLSADRAGRTLLLTGPNTGGKTVALKTAGLLVLMAHAGLHLPALDGTTIPLVDAVYCDIGDEQSIEQNLSTFSSHMTNIVRLMNALTERPGQRALVLLDELGAGTDPTEGAALASAVTLWLHRLNPQGLRVIITTHFSSLKHLALETDEMENASVEFDVETLKPTYRILMGWPGTSRALLIAERLGLDPEVVREASGLVDVHHRQTEETLAKLEEARTELDRKRESAASAARAAQHEAARYQEKVSRWEAERERLRERYNRQARRILEDAQRDLRRRPQDIKPVEERLSEAFRPPAPPPEKPLSPSELTPGRTVRIVSMDQNGVLLSPPDRKNEVTVLVGALRVKVGAADIAAARAQEQPRPTAFATVPEADDPGHRLVLVGTRAEAALRALDTYLDQATLAGRDRAVIVHGVGPGELARAIRAHLDQSPLVTAWRAGGEGEGGPGVTVVQLA
jgi:DNA mismatch repair protein MutS2